MTLKTRVMAEWEPLKTVVVHRPGIEMFFGLLEPFASLYERAFSRYGARTEHARLVTTLRREFRVEVILFKEEILRAADARPACRERLEAAARASIDFSGEPKEVELAWREFEKNRDVLDSGHFFNILLLHPAIDLRVGKGTRMIDLNITQRQPLSNLYFMRDQQVVTDRGIVLTRLAKPQRTGETVLTRLFWEFMGVPVVHEIREPASFEGGDFLPMGSFALIGTGDRTNRAGIDQFLVNGPGFDEIGVVRQPTHPLIPGDRVDPMVDMHLDTYCNVASSGVVVGSELLMRRAAVEVHHREGPGSYAKAAGETDLYSYIREKGFDVIDLTTLEQMAYAPNFLCIRDGTILAAEVDRIAQNVLENLVAKAALDPGRYGALLKQAEKDYRNLRYEGQFFPHKKEVYRHDIDAYPIILENLTGGYGGAHCMTCTLKRG